VSDEETDPDMEHTAEKDKKDKPLAQAEKEDLDLKEDKLP